MKAEDINLNRLRMDILYQLGPQPPSANTANVSLFPPWPYSNFHTDHSAGFSISTGLSADLNCQMPRSPHRESNLYQEPLKSISGRTRSR